jgi:hypothetical protein
VYSRIPFLDAVGTSVHSMQRRRRISWPAACGAGRRSIAVKLVSEGELISLPFMYVNHQTIFTRRDWKEGHKKDCRIVA